MKSILKTYRPEWLVNVLNGKADILLAKYFPKDYVGWVYIYCTKGEKNLYLPYEFGCFEQDESSRVYLSKEAIIDIDIPLNGKVVARFWCDRVEETFFQQEESFSNEIEKTLKGSCLTYDELWNYVENKTFYKIHISKLEVFDKPRELSEFRKPFPAKQCKNCLHDFDCAFSKLENEMHHCRDLTKAPSNYCYIESEE